MAKTRKPPVHTNKDPEFDLPNQRLENAFDILDDLRDAYTDIGKEITNAIKGITLATVDGLTSASKLYAALGKGTADIGRTVKMLDMFHIRSISAANAITRLQESAKSGFPLKDEELKEVNYELGRFGVLTKQIAKDTQMRRELTKTLTSDIETQTDSLLKAKMALANIDASAFDDTGVDSLAQFRKTDIDSLRKRMAVTSEEIEQGEYGMNLAKKYIEMKEGEPAILEKVAKLRAMNSAEATKQADTMLTEFSKSFDGVQEDWKKLYPSKDAMGSTGEVLEQINKFQNLIAGVTQRRYKIQIALNEAQIKENRHSEINNKLLGKYFAFMGDQQFKMLGSLGGIVNKTIAWRKEVSLIPMRFTILSALIQFSLDRFIALDKAAEKFRTETGFTIDQMAHVRKQVERVNVEFADMGVSIEKAYDSAKALTEEFQMTSLVTGEAVKNVALMSANLGVLEKDSASVLSTFQGLGGATEKAAFNVMKVGAGISGKVGVPFSLVMKDIANASENTLQMLSANPTVLMRSAIAARTLGTDLNKITQSQRKLLDFSTSITDELELSALLGTSISFQKSRQLAYDGRIEDAAKATLETVKAAGDFDKMSVYQREALAKAAGMELKDLSKMLSVDKRRKEIENGSDQAAKDRLKAQDEALKQLNEKNDLSKQSLADEYESEIRQQKMQGIITNLKNTIDAIAISMADILEPIITPLAKILVPTLKVVGVLFRYLGGAIKWFLDPIVSVANWIGKSADGLKVVASKVSFVKDETKELGYYFGDVLDILASIGKIAVSVVAGGYMMGLFFGQLGFPKVMELLKKPFTSVVGWGKAALSKMSGGRLFGGGAAPVPTPSVPPGATSVKPGAGSGMRDFLKNVGAGLKSMAGSKVAQGALNLLLASPGLITIIPGALLAGLIPKNSGGNIEKFLTGLAGGLKQMGTGKVTGGSANMILASIGLVAMIPGAIAATILGVIGKPIELGLKYLAKGIGYMASTTVLRGAFGIAAVGVSIIPFAAAMNMFGGVDWASVGIGALALVGFTAAAFGLGLLFSTGYGAIIFTAGVIGIAALGLALIPFGAAALIAGAGIKMFGDGVSTSVDPIIKLSAIDLTKTALGIGALGIALAAFGAGSAYAGLTSFVGGLLGGDPIAKMEKLSGIGPQLKLAADSIASISSAASQFNSINSFADAITKLAESLGKLNGQLSSMNTENLNKLQTINAGSNSNNKSRESEKSTPETANVDLSGIVSKLDEIYKGLVGGEICVYLDKTKISSQMSSLA